MEYGPIGNRGELAQQLVGKEHKAVLEHAPILLQLMAEPTVLETLVNHKLVTLEPVQVYETYFLSHWFFLITFSLILS